MRKITREAAMAFMEARPFKKDNTTIKVLPNVTIMKLFGNIIAYRFNDPDRTLSIATCGWKSATTKERLNALPGVHIRQGNGKWFLNDVEWEGGLTDVK